jgi:adenosylcobinamide-phosphate synthase
MFSLGLPDTIDPLLLALIALGVDAVIGDPARLYRMVPHPVTLIGVMIGALERRLNADGTPESSRFWLGLATTAIVVSIAAVVAWGIVWAIARVPGGWIIEALLASTLIAFRGLYDAVGAVARGLDESLAAGRGAVAHIVGRDPEQLDEAGVARAAVESLAENFSDGVVAPLFWYVILGLPGLAAYKAINTLDSMIGYRDARYLWFGRAAAKLDDAVNWLPARLAGVILCLASGRRAAVAFRIIARDANHHRSPNAGWPEAAVAGALGLALAGPRHYASGTVEDDWVGDGRRDAGAGDIRRARHLYLWAGVVLAALAGVLAVII